MVKRSTLIWIVTALALVAGFVVFDQLQTRREESVAERSRLMAFEVDAVTKLQVEQPQTEDADLIEVERDPEATWRITQPVDTTAEIFTVDNLLLTASELRPSVDLELDDPADLAQYGLDPAEATLTITLEGDETRMLKLGVPDFDNTGVYVQAEDGRIVTIPAAQKDTLVPTLFQIRDKNLLELPRVNIESILIEHEEEAVKVSAQETNWIITEPQTIPTDAAEINQLLNPLLSLQAIEVAEENKEDADLSEYELNEPTTRLTINLTDDDADPVTLEIGRLNNGNNGYYTINSTSPLVATISATLVNDLPVSVNTLRSKDIVPSFEIESIDQVEIEAADTTLSRSMTPIQPDPDSTENEDSPLPANTIRWNVSDQPDRQIVLDSFFTAIRAFKATDFTTEPVAALDTPDFTIRLSQATDPETPIVLDFAQDPSQVYVRTSYQPDILIFDADALSDLETVIASLKPLTLPQTDSSESDSTDEVSDRSNELETSPDSDATVDSDTTVDSDATVEGLE